MSRSFIVAGILALAATNAIGEDNQFFRSDNGVPKNAGEISSDFATKQQRWTTRLPSGISTPCVTKKLIFATSYDKTNKQLATHAIDRKSGKPVWVRHAPAKRIEETHRVGSPASSSPATNGKYVYSFFGSYGLLCYDYEGNLVWSKELGPFQDEFGASSSPVLAGGLVILNEDHDVDSHLIAIDQETGKTVWRTPRPGFTRSYSTPIVWNSGKGWQVIVAGALQLAGYDLKSGKKVWWVNGLSRIVDSTPVLVKDTLYVATWTPGGDQTNRIAMETFPKALALYDKNSDGHVGKNELPPGAVLTRFFRIDLNQDKKLNEVEWNAHARVFRLAQNVAMAIKLGDTGDVRKNVKWIARKGLPTVPSPTTYRDVVYMVKDGGIITTLDATTGKVIKRGRAKGGGGYYASPVAADGKVLLISEGGVLTVLKAAGEWEVIGTHRFDSRVLATPVIRNGNIYIRTDEALYCFGAGTDVGTP